MTKKLENAVRATLRSYDSAKLAEYALFVHECQSGKNTGLEYRHFLEWATNDKDNLIEITIKSLR